MRDEDRGRVEIQCSRCGFDIYETDPRTITFTRGGKPKETVCSECDKDEMKFNYRKTKNITSRLAMEALMARLHVKENIRIAPTLAAVEADLERVDEMISKFVENIWKNGLHKQYHNVSKKTWGASAKIGKLFSLSFGGSAGRILIQIDHNINGSFVSMVTDDSSEKIGSPRRQAIDATLVEVEEMFLALNKQWAKGIRLKEKRSIRII